MSQRDSGAPRVSYLVKWVERVVRLALDDALAPHGLTTPEYTALSVLRQREGLSSAQLARRTFVTAQAMNQVVISLERRGVIARKADPAHARVMRATLSAKGKALLAACDRSTLPVEKRLLAGLTTTEVDTLRRLLEGCARSLGFSEEADSPGPRASKGAGAPGRGGR